MLLINQFNVKNTIMKMILHILLLPIVLTASCKKNELTNETATGANTFSCKINGVIFKPYDDGMIDIFAINYPPLSVSNSRNSNRFRIYASNEETDQDIYIEHMYITQPGVYKLWQYPYRGYYSSGYADPGWFSTDSIYTGQLSITRCDTINKIYSGSFYFTAKSSRSRIVQITDGRFDIKE